jgi:hypothetical protein
LLEQIDCGRVFIELAGLIFLNPDTDQVPADVVALRQTVQRLAGKKLLRDLTLELEAVGAVPGFGLSSFENPAARSIAKLDLVRPEGPTPSLGVHWRAGVVTPGR